MRVCPCLCVAEDRAQGLAHSRRVLLLSYTPSLGALFHTCWIGVTMPGWQQGVRAWSRESRARPLWKHLTSLYTCKMIPPPSSPDVGPQFSAELSLHPRVRDPLPPGSEAHLPSQPGHFTDRGPNTQRYLCLENAVLSQHQTQDRQVPEWRAIQPPRCSLLQTAFPSSSCALSGVCRAVPSEDSKIRPQRP